MVEGNAEKFSSALRKGVRRRSSTGSGSMSSMAGVENSSVCIANDIRQKLGTIIEEGCNIQQVQTSTGASNSRYINIKTLKTEGQNTTLFEWLISFMDTVTVLRSSSRLSWRFQSLCTKFCRKRIPKSRGSRNKSHTTKSKSQSPLQDSRRAARVEKTASETIVCPNKTNFEVDIIELRIY